MKKAKTLELVFALECLKELETEKKALKQLISKLKMEAKA